MTLVIVASVFYFFKDKIVPTDQTHLEKGIQITSESKGAKQNVDRFEQEFNNLAEEFMSAQEAVVKKVGGECLVDAHCTYLSNSCPGGIEICAARWRAFCVDNACVLSRNQSSAPSEQWIDTCNEYKRRNDISEYALQDCYQNAAYAALRKSSDTEDYTVMWNDAFAICEEYIEKDSEQCKFNVCSNLSLGDGNMKWPYPEEEECRAEIMPACPDGSILDNIPCACDYLSGPYAAFTEEWLDNYWNKYRKNDEPLYCCMGEVEESPCAIG